MSEAGHQCGVRNTRACPRRKEKEEARPSRHDKGLHATRTKCVRFAMRYGHRQSHECEFVLATFALIRTHAQHMNRGSCLASEWWSACHADISITGRACQDGPASAGLAYIRGVHPRERQKEEKDNASTHVATTAQTHTWKLLRIQYLSRVPRRAGKDFPGAAGPEIPGCRCGGQSDDWPCKVICARGCTHAR